MPQLHVFQVLGLESKKIVAPTYEDHQHEHFLLRVTVQSMVLWADRGADASRSSCVYCSEGPHEVDLIALVGVNPKVLPSILSWKVEQSDTAGCISLAMWRVAEPQLALTSPQVPCLCLLRELTVRGVREAHRRALHERGDEAVLFDGMRSASRRTHFQCVLALTNLWRKGADTFASNLSCTLYC